MILIIEPDPDHSGKIKTRVVLDRGELPPTSLLDLRVILRKAIADLPGSAKELTVISNCRRPA